MANGITIMNNLAADTSGDVEPKVIRGTGGTINICVDVGTWAGASIFFKNSCDNGATWKTIVDANGADLIFTELNDQSSQFLGPIPVGMWVGAALAGVTGSTVGVTVAILGTSSFEILP